MPDVLMDAIKNRYRQAHVGFLKLTEGLTEGQMKWRSTPVSHNIAFQVWHTARLTDHFQSKIPAVAPELERKLAPGRQIWTAEGLAAKWGLDPASLGWNETGHGMDDAVAANLRLPGKEALLDYARRAFAAAERAVDALGERDFLLKMDDWAGVLPLGVYVIEYTIHDEWDAGYIAALRRAQGLPRALH